MSAPAPAQGGALVDLGPDDDEESAALRRWFDEQEAKNLDRLEEGGRTILQLVTALYGLIFAILALGDASRNLSVGSVRTMGLASLLLLAIALVAALVVVFPFATRYHAYSLTARRAAQEAMQQRKARALTVALGSFLLGLLAFALLTATMLLGAGAEPSNDPPEAGGVLPLQSVITANIID